MSTLNFSIHRQDDDVSFTDLLKERVSREMAGSVGDANVRGRGRENTL